MTTIYYYSFYSNTLFICVLAVARSLMRESKKTRTRDITTH